MTRFLWREYAGWRRPSAVYFPGGPVGTALFGERREPPATGPSHTIESPFVGQPDLAPTTVRFHSLGKKHWALDLLVAITMASSLSGCISLVDDVELATTEPSSRPVPGPPVAMLPPAVTTPTAGPERPNDPHGIDQRLASGKHPIEQAVPGSERVLLSVERSRGFSFALPARAKGVHLWIAVRCRQPVPLSLRTFDVSGRNTVMYSMRECPATDVVGGPLEATETRGVLSIPAGSPMHLTLVSGKLANADDRPGTRWPRKFLR